MSGTTVRLAGTFATNWDKMRKRTSPRVEKGVRAVATVLLAASKELVPTETGALLASGHINKIKGGLRSEFLVAYGGRAFDPTPFGPNRVRRPPYKYAWYVHQLQLEFLRIPLQTKRAEMQLALRENIK